MGIEVQIQYDNRTPLGDQLGDPQNRFARLVHKAWEQGRNEYPIVTSIDPYGDTLLNYLLVELLIPELVRLQSDHPEDTEVLTAIKELGVYVTEHSWQRLFLAFIGD